MRCFESFGTTNEAQMGCYTPETFPEVPMALIRFGIFEADTRSGELHRKGFKVRLQAQPFQVLALLLERPGEVVTRKELTGGTLA